MPIWLLMVLGGYVVCLHGSLQHEAVHGHIARSRRLNNMITYPPLALYFPYTVYREEHLKHHACEVLTDVDTDPESLYFSRAQWERKNRLLKFIYTINFTLAGRLIIGPIVSLVILWRNQVRRVVSGDSRRLGVMISHVVLMAAILWFASWAGDIPVWKYMLCFAYPGISLTLLRSYTEHRWSSNEGERTIIIEGSPLTRLLYMNNNFHWLHHKNPRLPWRQVAKEYYLKRHKILSANGNYFYRSYLQLVPRLWKDRLIEPVHPTSN